MKRIFKRFASFLIALTLVLSVSVPCSAFTYPTKASGEIDPHVYDVCKEMEGWTEFVAIPDEEWNRMCDQNLEIVVEQIGNLPTDDGIELRQNRYKYRTEYLDYEYKTVSGYAGNQSAPGGYRFETGGGFYYEDSGGPDASTSINLTLPKPWDVISVSANLGIRSSGVKGVLVEVPNTTDYFKLYITKVLKIRPYIVYEAPIGTEDWSIYVVSTITQTYNVSYRAVPV